MEVGYERFANEGQFESKGVGHTEPLLGLSRRGNKRTPPIRVPLGETCVEESHPKRAHSDHPALSGRMASTVHGTNGLYSKGT